MKLLVVLCTILVVLGTMLSSADAEEYKKPLEIKHEWKEYKKYEKYDKKDYGHGQDYGKKLVGHSKRYQQMKHSKF